MKSKWIHSYFSARDLKWLFSSISDLIPKARISRTWVFWNCDLQKLVCICMFWMVYFKYFCNIYLWHNNVIPNLRRAVGHKDSTGICQPQYSTYSLTLLLNLMNPVNPTQCSYYVLCTRCTPFSQVPLGREVSSTFLSMTGREWSGLDYMLV